MGFLRRLFGPKRPTTSPSGKDKRRWSFTAAAAAKDKAQPQHTWPTNSDISSSSSSASSAAAALDANKHAIAVATATAAVAEAALAAAHAAAEVVRLTKSGAGAAAHVSRSRYLAAVKIQSAFRGYLARRALRALKALVKLQALVRGNIVRKQTADMLRRMQTLVRVQARARASRSTVSESLHSRSKNSLHNHLFPENADRNGHQQRAYSSKYDGPSILKRCGSNANFRDVLNLDKPKMGSNWLDHWMEESVWNNGRGTSTRYANVDHDEKSDKILEVDTWKPHLDPQQSTRSFQMPRHVLASDYHNQSFANFDSPSKRSTKSPNPVPNLSPLDALSLSHLKYPIDKDEATLRSLGNSPQPFSASSRPGSSSARRGGPFTPAKSDRSWGYFSAYSSYPNYMANTESSQAKVRSQSAPRQRLEFEKNNASKRASQGYWDGWTHSDLNTTHDSDLRSSGYHSFNHMDRFGSASLR